MAFRNSVKVTMLSLENEKQHSYPAQPAFVFEPPAPEPETPPISNDAAPIVVAEPIAPTLGQMPDETLPAAIWHARANDLRVMTETLPSDITRELIPKIVALYHGLARDEGWREEDASMPPEEPQPEALPCTTIAGGEEPVESDAPAELLSPPPDAPRWPTHPRRPLPMGRRIARRRG
jgi:hypothetical protein